jgi:hypothetical protein
MTFWEKAARIPPILARLLARDNYNLVLTDAHIAKASGLSVAMVTLVSNQTSWDSIDLPTMRKFLSGCRLDFDNRVQFHRNWIYLNKNPQWRHLRRDELFHDRWLPMLKRHAEYARKSVPTG